MTIEQIHDFLEKVRGRQELVVLALLGLNGVMYQADVKKIMGLDDPRIGYLTKRLQKVGAIKKEREGLLTRLTISIEATNLIRPIYEAIMDDETVQKCQSEYLRLKAEKNLPSNFII